MTTTDNVSPRHYTAQNRRHSPVRSGQFLAKYVFDRICALVGLLVLWPVMLVIAACIMTNMPGGSVIFRQLRVGKNGKLFVIYKFRTMRLSRETDREPCRQERVGDVADNSRVSSCGTTVTVMGDSRVTPLGATLRRWKLDELPEIYNVLIGDMSFVGPRPDVPGYADKLEEEDREILLLRPGITGPASMKYRDEENLLARQADPKSYNDRVIWPDKVRINRYYLRHYSFAKDLQMIVCTVLGMKMKYNNETI